MKLKNPGKVYCLKDPFTLEVRYVGFTKQTLNERLSKHRHTAKKQLDKTCYQINWFRKCLRLGKEPLIVLLENNIPIKDWAIKEQYWMDQFDNLTNQAKGGCGIVKCRLTTSIERSSNAKKIKVVQMDMGGNFIKEWDYIKEVTKTLKIDNSSITRVCQFKSQSAGGFLWLTKEDYDKGIRHPKYLTASERNKKYSRKTSLKLYCIFTLKEIYSFKSCTEAAIYFNCWSTSFYATKKGQNKIFDTLFSILPLDAPKTIYRIYKEGKFLTYVYKRKQLENVYPFTRLAAVIYERIQATTKKGDIYKVKDIEIERVTNVTEEIINYIRTKYGKKDHIT